VAAAVAVAVGAAVAVAAVGKNANIITSSYQYGNNGYEDAGLGGHFFTGSRAFQVAECEVFAIAHVCVVVGDLPPKRSRKWLCTCYKCLLIMVAHNWLL
jgi:hypothetical protein